MVIHMLKSSYIFIKLESLCLVSYSYVLMQRILYLLFIAPHCKFTVTLVKHCMITKGPIRRLILVWSVVIEHDLISEFIVIVNSMFILSGVISIHLRLFFLTY